MKMALAAGLLSLYTTLVAPLVTGSEIVATDGHLVLEATGVVYDIDSGLEWYAGPDRGMNGAAAHDWVSGFEALGGGWRMPQREELDALYRIGDGVRNLTPLVGLSGYWIWSGQTRKDAARWLFNFSYGGEGWSGQAPSDGGRAIAVRIRQKYE